jgi:hypothetical protein
MVDFHTVILAAGRWQQAAGRRQKAEGSRPGISAQGPEA